jgi:hypothetical protein
MTLETQRFGQPRQDILWPRDGRCQADVHGNIDAGVYRMGEERLADGWPRLIERFHWLTRPGHDGDALTLRIGAEANKAQRKTRHSVIPANE